MRNASQLFQCGKYKKNIALLHMLLKTFPIFIRGHHDTLVTCKATMCNRVWSDLFLAKGENQIYQEYMKSSKISMAILMQKCPFDVSHPTGCG